MAFASNLLKGLVRGLPCGLLFGLVFGPGLGVRVEDQGESLFGPEPGANKIWTGPKKSFVRDQIVFGPRT